MERSLGDGGMALRFEERWVSETPEEDGRGFESEGMLRRIEMESWLRVKGRIDRILIGTQANGRSLGALLHV